MGLLQDPPQLAHPYRDDPLLRAMLHRALPPARLAAIDADLQALGDYALMEWSRACRSTRRKPVLTQWDAWGNRIDRIELTEAWQEGPHLTTKHAVLASGHEAHEHARLEEFARVYLYHVASEFYSCPLAMTDGAATALKASGNKALIERALPHLLSRDASTFWLSGQWMTENTGGSDVGHTETVARQDESGQWRLYGRKWFSSAVVGEMALALARPQGAGDGAAALALFYVETMDGERRKPELIIDRLKDKLGTHELPTAEIHLDGLPAWPLGDLANGVRQVAPMLNITRTWNAMGATASMARALSLARDYATRRRAFGKRLIDQPLHAHTLADMQAEFEAAFALTFEVAHLLGRVENGAAQPHEVALLRLLTPLAKLWTGKMAVKLCSEALECFGGAGYIEDTGLPQLLRDAQVYAIWEGTTNVLSLDSLRALAGDHLGALRMAIEGWLADSVDAHARQEIHRALDAAAAYLHDHASAREALEAGARGLALTLARCTAAALLARHDTWAAPHGAARAGAALRRFVAHGLTRLANAGRAQGALLQMVGFGASGPKIPTSPPWRPPTMQHLTIVTTGGTIDKIYFDDKSDYKIGSPQIGDILSQLGVAFQFDVIPILRKDSLHMGDEDRALVRSTIEAQPHRHVLVTHGTDTMVETAHKLASIKGKVIVLTGALNPARFQGSDAVFNIGCAVAAVQTLPDGVYITMNGRVWDPAKVRKNRDANRFEENNG